MNRLVSDLLNGENPTFTRIALGVFLAAVAVTVMLAVAPPRPTGPAYDHAAARAVDKVLTLRSELAKDPKAYSPYFTESAIATELARTSAELSSSPIPTWEAPYVSAEGSSGVEVAVKWVPSGDGAAPGSPGVLFKLRGAHGKWAIFDALEVTGTLPPPVKRR